MPKDDKANDFDAKTKTAIALRAAYICSNPDCRRMTVGPSEEVPDKFIYVGEAAHIRGARSGAARYDDTQTEEERSSAANGIFLCSACATMIDKNQGVDFPVELLHQWKAAHEAWVADNLNKNPFDNALTEVDGTHEAAGVGTVTGLDIQAPVIIKPGTRVMAQGIGEVTATRISSK